MRNERAADAEHCQSQDHPPDMDNILRRAMRDIRRWRLQMQISALKENDGDAQAEWNASPEAHHYPKVSEVL